MKLRHALLIPALAVAFAASASAQTSVKSTDDLPDAPQATAAALIYPNGPTVVMDTSMGRITCQFYQRQAPQTVANFIALAEGTKDWVDPVTNTKQHNKPLYNGTVFHRVIPEFMIQGGDPAATGMGGPGYQFEDEFNPDLNFDVAGRLAMANAGPNTNGSQFFITESAYRSPQPAPHHLRPVRSGQRPGGQGHYPRQARQPGQAAHAGGAEEGDHRARGPAATALTQRRAQTVGRWVPHPFRVLLRKGWEATNSTQSEFSVFGLRDLRIHSRTSS